MGDSLPEYDIAVTYSLEADKDGEKGITVINLAKECRAGHLEQILNALIVPPHLLLIVKHGHEFEAKGNIYDWELAHVDVSEAKAVLKDRN